MRRTMMAAAFAAAFLAPKGASAASATAAPDHARHGLAEPVQYYPDRYGHGGFDAWRHEQRHMRRAHEEERIAEAARREARRIEIERAERRAWRHAHRERFRRHNGF